MQRRAALLILQSVRRRIRQGDGPKEEPFHRELLEEALDELGPSPQAVKIMLDPDDEPTTGNLPASEGEKHE